MAVKKDYWAGDLADLLHDDSGANECEKVPQVNSPTVENI